MNENTVASSKLLVELLSGDGLNEMIAILIVIAIAIISGRLAKAGLVRIGSDVMVRPWTGRLIETAVILTPYLVAALLIGLAENTARQFGMAYNVLVLTSQLVVALDVVRIAVYCLRWYSGSASASNCSAGSTGWKKPSTPSTYCPANPSSVCGLYSKDSSSSRRSS